MAPDPERVADTRSWLVKAQHDLRAVDALLGGDEPLPDVAAYHAQQAAEKSLKAFLYWHDVAFRKTHELDELGRVVTEIDADLEHAVEAAVDLTPFAWRFKYPGAPGLTLPCPSVALAGFPWRSVVIRVPGEDLVAAQQLLEEHDPRQLVRQGHGAEREL